MSELSEPFTSNFPPIYRELQYQAPTSISACGPAYCEPAPLTSLFVTVDIEAETQRPSQKRFPGPAVTH
jgi:hypothetical protein